MINKKKKKVDDTPLLDYYDHNIGYTVSRFVNTKYIGKKSGKNVPGGIGSPESIGFMINLFGKRLSSEEPKDYNTRMKYLANKFVSLADETFQEFIIAAAQDGCRWRGEDFGAYRTTYDEYMEMQSDPQGYIKRARALMNALV